MPTPKKENYELVLYRLDQIDKKLDNVTKNYVTKEELRRLQADGIRRIKKEKLDECSQSNYCQHNYCTCNLPANSILK